MRSILFFSLFLISSLVQAQNDARLHGTVLNDKGEPLAFANVLAFTPADTSLVKATATTENGAFELEGLQEGDYMLQLVAYGFDKGYGSVIHLASGENKDAGTIQARLESNEMKEVEVVFVKPLVEVRPDKTVFNVEGTINSTGQNALDLLRRAPGVFVDQDENIHLKGRSDVKIYIDGKPTPLSQDQLAAMLKNMQSSNIESIELISNPSAKYDAAGTAGIINIKLKKNKNYGTNGSVNVGYALGIFPKYNGSVNLNSRNEWVNLFGTYGMNTGPQQNWMDLYREQAGKAFDQRTTGKNDNTNHQFKAGADFFLDSKNTLGFLANVGLSDENSNNNSFTNIGSYDAGSHQLLETDSTLYSPVRNDGSRNNGQFNLNYAYSDTSGTSFTADADYGIYKIKTTSQQPNYYADSHSGELIQQKTYQTIAPTDISIYSFKSDYERNALKGMIGIGVKLSMVKTDNTFDVYNVFDIESLLDSARSSSFAYSENINAAYINYKRQLTKLGIQAGLRIEQTSSHGELTDFQNDSDPDKDVKRTYTDLFPNLALSYNVNMNNAVNLSYSRRIDRPTYQDLNPFEFKLDELSYMKGNPFLRPQYTHNTELSWVYKYMYTASASYAYTKDFSTMNINTDGEASYIQQTNLGSQQYASLTVSAPIQITKWYSLFFSGTGYYLSQEATFDDDREIHIAFGSYNFFASNSFTLPKSFTFELSGWYNGPGIWGGTFENNPMGSLDAGLKKSFHKDMITLKLAYSDLLKTSHWRGLSDFDGQYLDVRGGWESQVFRVDFSMRFGNQQIRQRKHSSGADDLKNRVK